MTVSGWHRNKNAERLAEAFARGIEPDSEQRLTIWLFGDEGIQPKLAAAGWTVVGTRANESGWTSIYTDYCYYITGRVRMNQAALDALTATLLAITGPEGEITGWVIENA